MPEKKATKKAAKKKTPAKKAAAKKAAAKKTAQEKKTAVKSKAATAAKRTKTAAKKSKAKSSNPGKGSKNSSSGFSLEEALMIAKKRDSEREEHSKKKEEKERAQRAIQEAEERKEKRVLGAASLADILGYNPTAPDTGNKHANRTVPRKYQKYYSLLMELRAHVREGLNLHTEETLKRSSKDDAGDLSSYSQHMADAGTDTFDRDFALSMVSNEQEALTEIEAAIDRIYKGTYGICEMTGKPIREERLLAVPFTRYSMKTQAQLEKNKYRAVQRGGAFAESSSDNTMSFGDENPDT